jgi:tRNA acetyltransferase TAN1
MMNDFNLLVSTPRFREEDASEEILDLLEAFGDSNAIAELTPVAGILLVKTSIPPLTVIEKLKDVVASDPWEVQYVMRVLPIEKVVPAELEDISGAVRSLTLKIPSDASFKVSVEKRHSHLHSYEIIDYVAQEVKREVDLESPSWIVLIEIVGRLAGVSVVTPHDLFSSVIEKRDITE